MKKNTLKTEVFVYSCPKHENLCSKMKKYLMPLISNGKITVWDKTQIIAGTKILTEVTNAINRAEIAILFVSSTFWADDVICTEILPEICKKFENGSLIIGWVAVEKTMYDETFLSEIMPIYDPNIPIRSQKSKKQRETFLKIAQWVKQRVDNINSCKFKKKQARVLKVIKI